MPEQLRALHRELRACQRRLGTTEETPRDFERVLELAHSINNRITALYLGEAARTTESATPCARTIHKRYLR